jgi:hypothetical protein
VDDTPPRHIIQQAHRPSHLPRSDTDSLADIAVGGDETGWDGNNYITDILDYAHAGIRPLAGK